MGWWILMDWEEAMAEARSEIGYSPDEYVHDWQRLVEKAHEIQDYVNEEEREDLSFEGRMKHQEYLKSEEWKKLRLEILFRDNFKCKDCNKNATEVHHLTYLSLHTPEEKEHCISICNECHKKRHGIK